MAGYPVAGDGADQAARGRELVAQAGDVEDGRLGHVAVTGRPSSDSELGVEDVAEPVGQDVEADVLDRQRLVEPRLTAELVGEEGRARPLVAVDALR